MNSGEQSEWRHWKRVSAILCDRKYQLKDQGKGIQDSCYTGYNLRAETWAKKVQEKKEDVAECAW